MGPLSGRVAVVTGAAGERSIGRGIALALASRGADVVVNDVTHEDELAARVDELRALGRRSEHVRADVGDATSDWTDSLSGVTRIAQDDGRVVLALDATTDPQRILDAARAAGTVTHFSEVRPSLAELFRELVSA